MLPPAALHSEALRRMCPKPPALQRLPPAAGPSADGSGGRVGGRAVVSLSGFVTRNGHDGPSAEGSGPQAGA
jgi:hypothetical protein